MQNSFQKKIVRFTAIYGVLKKGGMCDILIAGQEDVCYNNKRSRKNTLGGGICMKKTGKVTKYLAVLCGIIFLFAFPMQAAASAAGQNTKTAAEVTSITMEKTKTIKVNQSVTLRPSVLPAKAVGQKLTWSSSDSSVASVVNGKVTGRAVGETVITARAANGKKAFCKVTVGITKTTTFDAFIRAAAELKKTAGSEGGARSAANSKFALKRLIVKTNGRALDYGKVKASSAVKGPEGMYVLQFATIAATESAMKTIEKWPGIVYVEPDSYVSVQVQKTGNGTSTIENVMGSASVTESFVTDEDAENGWADSDETVSSIGAVSNAGAAEASGTASADTVLAQANSWGVAKIGAATYAKRVASKRSNATIKVAVVDSGVAQHSFLNGRLLSGGYDFVDNDSNPYDEFGHGTHVAGTIVDCTPGLKVKILPVRVLNSAGRGTSLDIGSGIRYAADHGAKVINLSLTGDHCEYEEEQIRYAIRKGVTVVVSAGNDYSDIDTMNRCPAHMSSVICVGAVNSANKRPSFSNRGKTLDVAAPGVGILSCIPGGGYASWDGTSMAAPHVSALAAMLKIMNPSMTPAQVEKAIKNHCTDLGVSGWDKDYGAGIPNFASLGTVAVKQVKLNRTSVTVTKGKTCTLTATISPSNATNKKVTWSSSNTSVATVSSKGVVTAKKAGTATITAKSNNGKRASCKVTVKNPASAKLSVPVFSYSSMDENGRASIQWRSCSGAKGYRVKIYNYRNKATGTRYLSGASSTSWSMKLDKNTLYRISVCAYKVSSGKKVFGASRTVYLSAPRWPYSTNETPTAMTLNWSKITGLSGYRIYRSASFNTGYSLLKTLSANTRAIRITGINAYTYIRIIPYKTVNGKKINLPYATTTIMPGY